MTTALAILALLIEGLIGFLSLAKREPAVVVALPPAIDTALSTTTTTTTTTRPTTTQATTEQPSLDLGSFIAPSGYGPAVAESTVGLYLAADFEITVFGADDTGSQEVDDDLMLVVVPRADAGDSWAQRQYSLFGFESELAWLESEVAVRIASRSYDVAQLEAIAATVEVDGTVVTVPPPDGLVVVSRGNHAVGSGLLNNRELLRFIYPPLVPDPDSWWTVDPAIGTIYVWAVEASGADLDLVEYLGEDAVRLPLRGTTGVLADYPFDPSSTLSWVEDGLLVMLAADQSVDLVAMAETLGSDADSTVSLGLSAAQPALSGTDLGGEFVVYPSLEPTGVIVVCVEWRSNSEPPAAAGVTQCSPGGVARPFLSDGDSALLEPVEFEGEQWELYAGRAPDCVHLVVAGGSGASREVEVHAVLASDGHSYFALAVPLGDAGGNSPGTDPVTLVGLDRHVAGDASGATVDTTQNAPGGWGWTVSC